MSEIIEAIIPMFFMYWLFGLTGVQICVVFITSVLKKEKKENYGGKNAHFLFKLFKQKQC